MVSRPFRGRGMAGGDPRSVQGRGGRLLPGRRRPQGDIRIIFMTSRAQPGWEPAMDRFQCLECAYIYDPVKGDPTQGIPPGTPFEKLPTTWRCPECKISILKHGVFRKMAE
jgi:rubredoxin